MVADHPCPANRPMGVMFDVDEAHPFVGVLIANPRPADGLVIAGTIISAVVTHG
jgi:hypothetical protein